MKMTLKKRIVVFSFLVLFLSTLLAMLIAPLGGAPLDRAQDGWSQPMLAEQARALLFKVLLAAGLSLAVSLSGSSAKSVGPLWLGEVTKCVI